MDFFNKLGKKMSETYDATTEKTAKLAKEAKLRMKINEDKSDINDLYKQIGKKVYENHITGKSIDINKDLEEELTKIDVLSAEIETSLKTILELKNKKKCSKCNSEIDRDSAFCPVCGEKQPEEVKEVEVIEKEITNVEVESEENHKTETDLEENQEDDEQEIKDVEESDENK